MTDTIKVTIPTGTGRQVYQDVGLGDLERTSDDLFYVPTRTKVVRKLVNFDDVGIGTGVTVASLPAGAIITSVSARVKTAWNSTVSDALSLGYGAGFNELVNAQDAQSTGLKTVVAGVVPEYEAAAVVVKAKVVSAGVAPSQGQVEVFVVYAEKSA